MTRWLIIILVLTALPSWSQQLDPNNSDGDNGGFTLEPELDLENANDEGLYGVIEEVQQDRAANAPGAVLRALDRVSGALTDLELTNGQTVDYGRLKVQLGECRYPKGNPSGDAFGFLTIHSKTDGSQVFNGWMIASSPALNALDHPRYDVWVLRCKTS